MLYDKLPSIFKYLIVNIEEQKERLAFNSLLALVVSTYEAGDPGYKSWYGQLLVCWSQIIVPGLLMFSIHLVFICIYQLYVVVLYT